MMNLIVPNEKIVFEALKRVLALQKQRQRRRIPFRVLNKLDDTHIILFEHSFLCSKWVSSIFDKDIPVDIFNLSKKQFITP